MGRSKKKKSARRTLIIRILIISAIIVVLAAVIKSVDLYRKVLRTNVVLETNTSGYLYIPTGSTFEEVCRILSENGYVRNINTFIWVAEKKNYPNHVYPGKYKISGGMNNNELVNLLRSGEQEPVKVKFQNVRTAAELAGEVAKEIEADSSEILDLIRDEDFIGKFGFNSQNVISMFIPNTYEFYWNTSAEEFFNRMAAEYKKFWNESRLAKARALNLSQSQVSTLASIVQAEQTIRIDERPTVAGLYINRLRKGMRLESDPTVIFAMNKSDVRRVLNADRKTNSPYNTYMYGGIPPGPINIPDISSIDAVLNYEKHDYIFMCAKEDFSGYHNFSRTNDEHNVYAARYRSELDKRKIYR